MPTVTMEQTVLFIVPTVTMEQTVLFTLYESWKSLKTALSISMGVWFSSVR